MNVPNQQLVIDKVQECYHRATSYCGRTFELPTIYFNQRGKIAGCARLQLNQLHFNPVLLEDNLDVFLQQVVPHEVCHLLTFIMYGKVRPHGKEWQASMIALFGLEPQTYHQMDVAKVKGKSFNYQCSCGPVELSIRRHNKMVRGQQYYICKVCNDRLILRARTSV